MKNIQRVIRLSILMAVGLLAAAPAAKAVNYVGNGNTDFAGVIGDGVLSLTDDGTNFYGSLTVGNPMNDALVIYIDTGAAGGFSTTTNFNDQLDLNHVVISGVSSYGRSVMTFTNGFSPLYAISLIPSPPATFGGLYKLANGGNNSFTYETSVNLSPTGTSNIGPFNFSFPCSAIGLASNVSTNVRFFGTYISTTAYRSGEAVAGNDSEPFGPGWSTPFNQTAYATYTFDNKTATNYPVVFSVDMTAQIANNSFNPNNGDKVYCAGSFQSAPWSGFQLFSSAGNTNIYTGTNQNNNPSGIAELYKFNFYSVANSSSVWEFGRPNENRPYTATGSGQTLSLVYFNDYAAIPSVTTNAETFQVEMGAQIALGQFNPATEQIEAYGTFENPQWSAGFVLTNNPSAADTNLYAGIYQDRNYPGTWQQYKFVIVSNGVPYYESINNRTFYTPTNAGTLNLAYFNNISPYATPVTFQVDMTLPLLNQTFNPGNGDTVGAAGTFETNQWTVGASGFKLTNNPAAANSNVYSGTYTLFDQPGTGEFYKFVINSSGGSTIYEQPASTGGGNRQFVNTTQTLPVVYWDDADPADYLSAATYITFTVNMTNAVDMFGNPFDPNNDIVMVDGDFTNPQWQVLSHATDPLINSDYPQNVLTNTSPGTGSLLYSAIFLVPAGNPLMVNYKYGIYHNTSDLNTNVDNEAGYAQNHVRYIRATGTYHFPVDIFGQQRTNAPDPATDSPDPAAAIEPEFGELAIGVPAAGKLPITWLGLPSVHLQTSTNLSNPIWQDLNATVGLNSTNWPNTGSHQFFRLIQP